jgi:hypothetical protein
VGYRDRAAEEEMVLVPRRPTEEMLKAGWYEANDENAAGVWRDMIEAWELSLQPRKLSRG